MLFHAWRRGQREAGVMLFLALVAIADSIDTVLMYLADKHRDLDKMHNHRFNLGPIEFSISILSFAIFASLIAVILYRFVHVVSEEQRSNAEIAAARSVQAMLIPTELPSNKYFMLESAYVPVNGVGATSSALPVKMDRSHRRWRCQRERPAGRHERQHAGGRLPQRACMDPSTILQHLNTVLIGVDSSSRARDKDSVVSHLPLCPHLPRRPHGDRQRRPPQPYRDGREIELPPGLPLGVIPGMTAGAGDLPARAGGRASPSLTAWSKPRTDEGELFGFERTQQVSNESARYIAQTAKRFGQNDDITVISITLRRSKRHAGRARAHSEWASGRPEHRCDHNS